MTGAGLPQPDAEASNETAAAIFQREWRIYRKMVENNYFFHREAYARLRRVLLKEASRPFQFIRPHRRSSTFVGLRGFPY